MPDLLSDTIGRLAAQIADIAGRVRGLEGREIPGRARATVNTTDATATTVLTYTIPASTTVVLVATVAARRTGGAAGAAEDGAGYLRFATVKNVAGVATIIGAVFAAYTAEDQAGWNCTIDVTGATARVRVIGALNNDVAWFCALEVHRVSS